MGLRLLMCMVVIAGLVTRTAGGQCTILNERSSAEQLMSFLRTSMDASRAQPNPDCVEFALRHLEYKSSSEAAELVIHYLDFERPLTEAERQGFMVHGPMMDADMNPAIGTLVSFGKVAIPVLLSAIADPPSTVIARNATHSLMEIYRTQPVKGIELIKQSAQTTPSPRGERLRAAATDAVQWCAPSYRQQCKAAIGK